MAWPRFMFLALIGGGCWWLLWDQEQPGCAWCVGGVFLGMILRDIWAVQQAIELWPATLAILDHKKLDDLIGEPPSEHAW